MQLKTIFRNILITNRFWHTKLRESVINPKKPQIQEVLVQYWQELEFFKSME